MGLNFFLYYRYLQFTNACYFFIIENDVDGEAFLHLEEKHLNSMGISLGQGVKLLRYISSLSPTPVSSTEQINDYSVHLIGTSNTNRNNLDETLKSGSATETLQEQNFSLQIDESTEIVDALMDSSLSDLYQQDGSSMPNNPQLEHSQEAVTSPHNATSFVDQEVFGFKSLQVLNILH